MELNRPWPTEELFTKAVGQEGGGAQTTQSNTSEQGRKRDVSLQQEWNQDTILVRTSHTPPQNQRMEPEKGHKKGKEKHVTKKFFVVVSVNGRDSKASSLLLLPEVDFPPKARVWEKVGHFGEISGVLVFGVFLWGI